MADENQHEAPNADDATGTAFAEIPYVPAASALNRPMSRNKLLVLSALAATHGERGDSKTALKE